MSKSAPKLPMTLRRASASDNQGGLDCALVDADSRVVAECFEVVGPGDRRDCVGLAALFAASPYLLEACKAVLRGLQPDAMHNIENDSPVYRGLLAAAITMAEVRA